MKSLHGKVALVTGTSRGIGKGIALGLSEAGATVYVTGRTVEEGQAAVKLAGNIHKTAEEVSALGQVLSSWGTGAPWLLWPLTRT